MSQLFNYAPPAQTNTTFNYAPPAVTPPQQGFLSKVGSVYSSFANTLKNTIAQPVANAVTAARNTAQGAFQNAFNVGQNIGSQYGTKPSLAQDFANAANVGGAALNVGFLPFTTAMSAAAQIPILKPAVDKVNTIFSNIGKGATFVSDNFVNVLPVSQQTKDIIKQPLETLASTAAQVYFGGKIIHLIATQGNVSPTDVNTAATEARQLNVQNLTPDEIKIKIGGPAVIEPYTPEQLGQKPLPIIQAGPTPKSELPTINEGAPYSKIENPLMQEALKYKSAEEFHKAFSLELKHGTYYHITDNPNFTINPNLGPRDMVSTGQQGMEAGKLMVTSDLRNWAEQYPNRKYVAVIDMSKVAPEDYWQSNRQFGNEFYVNNPANAKVIKVIPIKQALKEDAINRANLETLVPNKQALTDIWNKAQETKVEPSPLGIKYEPIKAPEGAIFNYEAPKTETPRVTQVEPLVKVQKTGEPTKAAADINATLIKQGYDALPIEEQSKYTPESYKAISQNLSQAMDTNLDNVKQMATGELPLDKKLYGQGEIVFKTISQLAAKEGDAELLTKLAASPFGKKASLAGQTLGELGYVKSDGNIDTVSAIRQVQNSWDAKLKSKGTSFDKEVVKTEAELKPKIKSVPRQSWADFVNSISC